MGYYSKQPAQHLGIRSSGYTGVHSTPSRLGEGHCGVIMRWVPWSCALLGAGLVACSEYKLEGATDASEADTGIEEEPDEPVDPMDPEDPPDPEDTYGISGRVCNPAGGGDDGWVAGAYVYVIVDEDGDGVEDWRSEDTTDSEGRFLLTGLPPGFYLVQVEKGSFHTEFEVELEGGLYEIPEEECALEPPTIAVVTGEYDHIEDILDALELEYTLVRGTSGGGTPEFVNFLRNPTLMEEFDMIFFNCGVSDYDWMAYQTEISGNIRNYVDAGGSVYASDWAYYLVESAFSPKIDFFGEDSVYGSAQVGVDGPVMADVLDPVMQALLGGTSADINYDLGMWVVPQAVNTDVEILLEARVSALDLWTGSMTVVPDAPIASRFDFGEGRVIYTSFHNEHQTGTTLDMMRILEEIVLSL